MNLYHRMFIFCLFRLGTTDPRCFSIREGLLPHCRYCCNLFLLPTVVSVGATIRSCLDIINLKGGYIGDYIGGYIGDYIGATIGVIN